MNEKKKAAAERKALRLIKTELSLDPGMLFLLLDPEEESYEEDVKITKLLFNNPDPDCRMALWNGFGFRELNARQQDFTEAEWSILKEKEERRRIFYDIPEENPNKPFRTDRLVLRPATEDDNELYREYLKNDGDFTMFTCRKYSGRAALEYTLLRPLFFSVCEKSTGDLIGYVGFVWHRENGLLTGTVTLEYYIFKKYRCMGYASEAVIALCRRGLAGKLREMRETNYEYVFKSSKANIKLIRAYIRSDNEPSKKLAESCGFVHSGTLHRGFYVEGVGAVDKEVYEYFG